MSESNDPRPVSKVARRTLIAGAAWAVPTVAVLSATPAFAASPAGALSATTPEVWNLNYNGEPGPIGLYLQVSNSTSASITFTWKLTVIKPDQTSTVWKSGGGTAASYGIWQNSGLIYLAQNQNLPAGKYTFVFSITYGSSSSTQSSSITI